MDLGSGIDTTGAAPATPASYAGSGGHPYLSRLDEVRNYLVQTGLPPEPPIYEVFYHYVAATDASLNRAVEDMLAHPPVQPAAVDRLRLDHLGAIDTNEMAELLTAAHTAVDRLTASFNGSETELSHQHGELSRGRLELNAMLDPATLALLVDRLSEACTATLKANRDMTREIGVARRDTERLRARLEAAERSMRTDEVTGLLNQHGIFCILRGALDNFQSAGTTFALALIEPDKFGRLYESWGPTLGNEVIRAIGQHIEMAARTASPGAFTGRIAGFKYLVGLPGLTIGQACKVVDGMRAEVARKVIRRASDGASLGRISLSAGVAMPHVNEADAELLIDRADMALFAASQAGGDRVLPERAS